LILTFFTDCFEAKSTDLDVTFVGEECDFQFDYANEDLPVCRSLRLSDCGCCENGKPCGGNDAEIQFQKCFDFLSKEKTKDNNKYFDKVGIEYLQLNSTDATRDGNRRRLQV
jgi:hypothetical protein